MNYQWLGAGFIAICLLSGCASASGSQSGEQVSQTSSERAGGDERNQPVVQAEATTGQTQQERTRGPMSLFDSADDTVYPYGFRVYTVALLDGPMPAVVYEEGLQARAAMMSECFPGTLSLTGSERWSAEIQVVADSAGAEVQGVSLGREAQRLPEDVRECLVGDFTRVRLSFSSEAEVRGRIRVDFGVKVED